MFNHHRVLATVTVILWGPMRFPPVPAEPLLGIPILWGSLPAPGLQASSLSKSFQGDASGTVSICDSCKWYKRPAHIQTEKNWSMASVGPCVGKLPQRSPLLCCFQCMLIKELEGKPAILPERRLLLSLWTRGHVISAINRIHLCQPVHLDQFSQPCMCWLFWTKISFQMGEFNIFPVTNKNVYIQ